ncbi:MAG: hypothetical protein WCG14_05025 [Chlamydiia bacterium]
MSSPTDPRPLIRKIEEITSYLQQEGTCEAKNLAITELATKILSYLQTQPTTLAEVQSLRRLDRIFLQADRLGSRKPEQLAEEGTSVLQNLPLTLLHEMIEESKLSTFPAVKQMDLEKETFRKIHPTPQMTPELLANLCADEFIRGSSYEGISSDKVLLHLSSFLKGYQSTTIDPAQIEALTDLLERALLVDTTHIRENLQYAINMQCPCLIPGGWVAPKKEGHAVYYLITPMKDFAIMTLCNTGAGIAYHPHAQVGVEWKIAPLQWRVPIERLLDPTFSQIIEEMNTYTTLPNKESIPTQYGPKDIYVAFKTYLSATDMPVTGQLLTTPQYSGTCASSSLIPILQQYMQDEYELFQLALTTSSLTSYLSSSGNTRVEQAAWTLVQKTSSALDRKIQALYHRVDKQQAAELKTSKARAQQWMEQHKRRPPIPSYDLLLSLTRLELPIPISPELLHSPFSPPEATPLPQAILEDPNIQELFTSEPITAYTSMEGVYEFTSAEGYNTRVYSSGQGFIIEQQGNDLVWRRFIPTAALMQPSQPFLLPSRSLAERYHFWNTLEANRPSLLCDKRSKQIQYRIYHKNHTITNIERTSDGALLGNPPAFLTYFERPDYIHQWLDIPADLSPLQSWPPDFTCKEIELPRFHLSFLANEDQQLVCQEHPGWWIDPNQHLEAIGRCNYALILCNEQDRKTVILPHQTLQARPDEKESLAPIFDRAQHLDTPDITFTYFLYRLEDGDEAQLVCPSIEAAFYLVQTLAVFHEYSKAGNYLRRYGKQEAPYSEKECQALTEITQIQKVTGDRSGEQQAISLYAYYLLITHNRDYCFQATYKIVECYYEYLIRLPHISGLQLTQEEEKILASLLPTSKLTPKESAAFTYRAEQLGNSSWTEVTELPRDQTSEAEVPIDFAGIIPTESLHITDLPKPSKKYPDWIMRIPITRSALFITQNLLSFIRMAQQENKVPSMEKKWLETACIFLLHGDSTEHDERRLGHFLSLISQHPSSFPNEITRTRDFSEWRQQMEAKAQELHGL